MDENMDLNKQDMNMNENQLNNFMEAVENMDLNKQVFEKDNELESDTEDVLQEFANPNAVIEEVIVDEAIDMYSKYAEMGGFEVKKSGQRLTKSGVVKHKYIMCNREGVPKEESHVILCDSRGITCDSIVNHMSSIGNFVSHFGAASIVLKSNASCLYLCLSIADSYDIMKLTSVAPGLVKLLKNEFSLSDLEVICKQIYNETDFKERFDKIVWNMFIEPLKFEEKWAKLIEDFGLQNHKWMTKMFNIREIWIPAYFVDSPLFGLMRTTSRSESENSFFKSFTSPGATLVSFMMSYESAMERQRYRQEALDFKTIEAAPKCETKLPIELHAARVYTRTIFLLVQTEIIQGCWTCTIQDLKINEGCETVIIRDKNPKNNTALNTKKGKEQEKKSVAETARDFKASIKNYLADFHSCSYPVGSDPMFSSCLIGDLVVEMTGLVDMFFGEYHGRDNTVRGIKKYPTIMLEAVASHDLWIWHAFFGVAGANNDIYVLDNSSLFDDLLDDKATVAPYVVNGVGFEKGNYLADGIYPQWTTFVKSFTVANDAKHAYFEKRQESARKDVERAFGVLQGPDVIVFFWCYDVMTPDTLSTTTFQTEFSGGGAVEWWWWWSSRAVWWSSQAVMVSPKYGNKDSEEGEEW
ncbi:FAR1-related sequence 5-like protein [Tanacetum coccineum]